MDRTARFRELFRVGGDSPDLASIPGLMRFGGFGDKDAYLVESAVRVSPELFRASFSDPDADRARKAAESLRIPGIMPIIQDMREALGLNRLQSIQTGTSRREMFRRMISERGRSSLTDGSMSGRGFLPEDVLMVSYIARCSRRSLEDMAWDPDIRTANYAAQKIAEDTSLDLAAVLALMEDVRSEETMRPAPKVDPGLVFKKSRPSEARLVRYNGKEKSVQIPYEVVLNGVKLKVTSVSDNAFARNTDLMEVLFPTSVQSIGRYAFFGYTALADVVFSEGLKAIGPGAFCRCVSLESADLPRGLESIGDQAFLGCSIEEMYLPETVASYGKHSFPSGCRLIGPSIGTQQ